MKNLILKFALFVMTMVSSTLIYAQDEKDPLIVVNNYSDHSYEKYAPAGLLHFSVHHFEKAENSTLFSSAAILKGDRIEGSFSGNNYHERVEIRSMSGYYICAVGLKKFDSQTPVEINLLQGTKQMRTHAKCQFSQDGNGVTINIINF
ncbi:MULTISPECIES: hypothetical protein [Legionella]|uniref:Uncharacterized protein n=1 Tax=Legionella drozanskii LLAP-1 TaxID=1212489 RepID=A0A0W0TE61_9GAMM|nr:MULTISPECIES: hypothetical protein [Legionella]KTC93856.1 hypothetical protein Ldro_0206 [Legionella drozanskii LLAP-1]PJE10769.1 MAG: hypothetical protein CK430_09750 [Legionella sp.]